jgi:hypothetical protein
LAQVTGNVTLHGITDAQLIKILKVKEKDKQVAFNPQSMQPVQSNAGSSYNNVIISWQNDGLKTVRDLLSELLT